MTTFLTLLFLISFGFIIYYVIKRFLTKKKDIDTYTKIKNRVWYAVIIFIISFVAIGITSGSDSTQSKATARTIVKKVGTADKKKAESKYESIKTEVSSKKSEAKLLTVKLDKKESEAKTESKKKESEAKVKSESESKKKLANEKAQSESIQKINKQKVVAASKTESSQKVKAAVPRTRTTNSVSHKQQTRPQQKSATPTHTDANKVTTGGETIIGNINSKIYHVPGQAGYHMNSANAITFHSEQDAQNAGYRKAKR
ncbi:sunset domain-containing protein [Dellaglioa sp. L3N]